MKPFFNILLFILLFNNMQAQTLVGNWTTNALFGNQYEPEEFEIRPAAENGRNNGLILNLKADGTFSNRRIPGCGQDRNPPTFYGTYQIIDENYIHFKVEKSNNVEGNLPNQDLGNYYYYRKSAGFNLRKSTGTLEHDKQMVFYHALLIEKDKEIKSYEMLLDWKKTTGTTDEEIVAHLLTENQIQNFEILYAKPVERYRQIIFLIKVGTGFRHAILDKDYNRIALYDDNKIIRIDDLITKINSDKKLNAKTIKEIYNPQTSSSKKNTIVIYQKKNKKHKVVYNQNFVQGGGWFTTIYFENNEPIYVEYEQQTIQDQKERSSKIGCYLLDLPQNKIVIKTLKSETGTIYYPSGFVNRVLEQLKSND